MKKRFLSVLLALVMVVSLLPMAVFAEDSAYDALKNAIEAAPDGVETTVTLTGDITGMTTAQIITIPSGKNIVLDMAGHSITVASNFQGRPIDNDGTLTVKGNGTIDSSASAVGYGAIRNDGTLTIMNGRFIGNVMGDGTAIRNGIGSKLTVYGGYFAATGAIYNVGEATIYKGEFETLACSACGTPWAYALNNRDENGVSGRMQILPEKDEDVIVHGTQGALAAAGGATVYVKGGTFYTHPCKDNHTYSTFYALYVSGKADTTATCVIDGGDFSTTGKNACLYVHNTNTSDNGGAPGESVLTINGGTFDKGTNGATMFRFTEGNNSRLDVAGGEFCEPVDEQYLSGDVKYQVSQENSTTSYHKDLSGANAAATAKGGSITSSDDPDASEILAATLDGNGGNITIDIPMIEASTTGRYTQKLSNGQITACVTDVSRSGYTFLGWKDQNGDFRELSDTFTTNVYLTAQWSENSTSGDTDLPGFLPGFVFAGAGSQMQHFVDVTSMDYYFDAVNWAYEHGITGGTGKVTFSPDAPCTRAQAVTFLWRAMGSPRAEKAASFTDVKEDAYYADAVAWAVENGITKGTSATTFSPDAPCTRAQIVTLLYRAIGVESTVDAGFVDVPATAYYADAVNWATQYKITGGTGANRFSPNATCTRGQIVTFLYRAK